MAYNPFNTVLMVVGAVIMLLMVGYIIAPVIHDIGIVFFFLGVLAVVFGIWAQIEDVFWIGAVMAAVGLIFVVGANSYISTFESNPVAKTVLDAGTTLVNSTKGTIP